MGSDVASEKRRNAYSKVAGKFIEAHRQTARFGPNQIDLHDNGHRPRETLIDAEQRVGGNNPFPTWCPHHHERHWQSEQPTDNEHAFAPPNVGKMTRHKVGKRLDDAELTMKETTNVVEAILNSSEPISGTTVRSRPTMPPTKALIRTRSENCGQLARRPRMTLGALAAAVIPRPCGRNLAPGPATPAGEHAECPRASCAKRLARPRSEMLCCNASQNQSWKLACR